METKVLPAGVKAYDAAKKIILGGGIVAFPTETVYGLGANAYSDDAVKKIFIAKGRPNDNPLIVHLENTNKIESVCSEITVTAKKLIKEFMPGPITIVLKKSPKISNFVTCNLDTVAVRVPQNKYAVEFIKMCGCPIAAPSANTSGRPSPTLAQHVLDDLNGKIPLIIDGGMCDVGIESTVVDASGEAPVILRPGKITAEDIIKVCGKLAPAQKNGKIISPGTKYKHYAPVCDIYLFDAFLAEKAGEFIDKKTAEGLNILAITKNVRNFNLNKIINYQDEFELAKNLYSYLRTWENIYDIILIEKPDDQGMGSSVLNRLLKASGGKIID